MLKGKILIVVFLLSIIIFAGNAFALLPGTKTHFLDTENPTGETPAGSDWVHILTQGDFYNKPLDDDEPIDVKRARLFLSLDFTTNDNGKFKAQVEFGDDGGGTILSKLIKYSYSPNESKIDKLWTVRIPSSFVSQINDKTVEIKIITQKGSLDDVNYSTIIGKATVAPEPISMVLVGVGIAGLPIAGRIRRFIKRDN